MTGFLAEDADGLLLPEVVVLAGLVAEGVGLEDAVGIEDCFGVVFSVGFSTGEVSASGL